MGLTGDPDGATTMASFPPGRRGVLLPVDDRATAALGIAMYTASKPWVLAVQRAAYWCTRVLGTVAVPGRRVRWVPPMPRDEWAELRRVLDQHVGGREHLAVYHRRQGFRDGLTMTVTGADASPVVVKLRARDDTQLDAEQAALDHVVRSAPVTFDVPRPLGYGSFAQWQWSAQSAVFTRPHRPCLRAPAELFEELDQILATLPGHERPPGHIVQHGDLTPWNLRLDHRGAVWLFDWESVGPLPPQADCGYFHANAAALRGSTVDATTAAMVPVPTWDHWIEIADRRHADTAQDETLLANLRRALSAARVAATDQASRDTSPH